MQTRRLLPLFFLITLIIVGGISAGASGENSIVYGLTLEPSGIDPHINRSSELGIILRQVYDTLIYRDPETKNFVPGLATEWTISDDGLIYTFTLRQGVKFHDGTVFNAQAVAANIDRIIDPETRSQLAVFMLGTFDHYEIADEYTISLVLSESYSPLLDSLSQVYLGIASPTTLAEFEGTSRYQFHQIGTGPFVFDEFVPGDRIVLRRNGEYAWGPVFYNAPTGDYVDEIVYRFFTDPPTRSLALEGGEVQIIGELLPPDALALTGNSSIRLLPTAIPGQPLQFLMNVQQYPTDNIVVRQALIYATNRSMIVDTVFQSFSPVAWGPLAVNTQYANGDLIGLYDYDVQQARGLLTSAGFEDTDNNGFFDAGDGDLEVHILYAPWGLLPQVAQVMQDQWRDAGIKAVLTPVPGFSALMGAVGEGDYNLIAFNSFGYDPAFLSQYFMTGGSSNFTNYSDPQMDTLLMTAVRENSTEARGQLYAQIQQIIMDQALILPVRDYVNLNATDASIENLQYDPYGWFPLINNVTITGD